MISNALITGILPTISMTFSSLVVFHFDIMSSSIENYFQNFCAGLILGATAIDLFPLLEYSHYTSTLSYQGYLISLAFGFIIGILLLNGVEYITELSESHDIEKIVLDTCNASKSSQIIYNNEIKLETAKISKIQLGRYSAINIPKDDDDEISTSSPFTPAFDAEDEGVELALRAMTTRSGHKETICERVTNLINSINSMNAMIFQICEIVDCNNDINSPSNIEEISENIDRECHMLQYNLDNCRRLLQGSFSGLANITVDKWKDVESRQKLLTGLYHLKFVAEHILEHINEENLDNETLREMHNHMHDMDKIIEKFHKQVEVVAFKWKRRKELPIPITGSEVPFGSLIIPVIIDCIIDGFVIGLTTSISFRAGFILSLATSIEMAFLGIAVSIRIKRCSGSHLLLRYSSVVVPPLFVCIFAVLGINLGNLSRDHSFFFISFVAFGIYCLLNLTINELLVEARGGKEEIPWQLNSMVFLGLFIVITLNSSF